MAQAITEVSGAGGHIIRRPRLTRLLDEAETPLLLLVAPAGYGKTTLAREWVAAQGRKSVWFRAGESCTDPAALAQELANVLESVRPGVARRVADHLKVADTPDVDILTELLTDTDASWPSRAWFVVDDYHAVMRSADAERLLENVCRSVERVLIATRERPTWVDARFLLYGEAFELGQSALAMTHEEAEGVFANAERKPAGLVALANGWPAVIGLAALLPEGITPTADVPGELHEFFAQELYKTLDIPTRRALVLLSLPNTIDSELVVDVLKDDPGDFAREAIKRGFVAPTHDGGLEIHPLVRSFLLQKLAQERGALTELIDRLVAYLLTKRAWDDVFTVIERTDKADDARLLIGSAMLELLNTARSATLETWLAWADTHRVEGPEVTLARAELLLRLGDWSSAESLAEASARALAGNALGAEAYICAGRAAHLQDKRKNAHDYFGSALRAHDSYVVRRQALWGRFITAPLDDDEAVTRAIADLEALNDPAPSHVLRMHESRLILAIRRGGVSEAATEGLAAVSLLNLVEDPLIRSSFLNALTAVLRLAARYDDALHIAELELEEAHERRLQFVIPEALLNRASAKLGLGDYTGAFADIDRARRDETDSYLLANAAAARARVHLSRGQFKEAELAVDLRVSSEIRSDLRSEVVATQALVAACRGDATRAASLCEEAAALTPVVDTRVLAAAAQAMVEVKEDGANLSSALGALAAEVIETGNLDSAICAFRAERRLAVAASVHGDLQELFRVAALRTRDTALAGIAGIALPQRTEASGGRLSQREAEVLALAAQGFTNAGIAERLFISSKTVKTHLQNIYAKLGARSRTEAVVRAKEGGDLGGQ